MMKKNKKIAVFSVVFPNAERFLNDYLDSLENQTYKDFDVIIVNDNVPAFGSIALRHNLNIIEIPFSKSIAKNRELGITYAKKAGYDYLVFSDSDDISAPNRIAKSAELLKRYNIVVNDLATIDDRGRITKDNYISGKLRNGTEITLDFISDKNICGFGNTAMRLDCLREKIVFHSPLIAVDWYFFTLLLKKGYKAIFTDETTSFYRIYGRNIAGLNPRINKAKIKNDLFIVMAHYKALAGTDKYFKDRYKKLTHLLKDIENNSYANAYIDKIKPYHDANPVWWEHIRLPEEIGL